MNRRWFLNGALAIAAAVTGAAKTANANVSPKLPRITGYVLNVSTRRLDDAGLVYGASDGKLDEICGIYDGGAELESIGDFPTTAALERADIPPGRSATCLAEGRFRLASPPVFDVTVDAVGANLPQLLVRRRDLCGMAQEGSRAAALRSYGVLLD